MKDIISSGKTLTLKNKNEIILQKCLVDYRSESNHDHTFVEIAYIDSGTGTHHTADGVVTQIEKGNLFLLTPNVGHKYQASPKNPLVVYNCIFSPTLLYESIKKDDDFLNIVYKFHLRKYI